ncbi:hypothetical protein [Pseudomonas veronii]|uniref:hypothetical protein n=1 Tax=Pseudomonas veronii TaxID=76761 RepID=UPI000625960F
MVADKQSEAKRVEFSKIVAIYKRRMQIEEDFRDVKSEHLGLGLGLNLHLNMSPKRIEVLLLIAALANYLLFLTGLQARERDQSQTFQRRGLIKAGVTTTAMKNH